VEAVHHDLRAYTVVIKSNLVLITKTATGHVLAYVVDRTTGEPQPGAGITAVSRNGSPQTAQTDANGLASFSLTNPGTEQDVRMVAKHQDDYAVGDIASWNLSSRGRPWTGLIYTDRPIYRPGDTVHFRGILRMNAAVGYEVPSNQKVAVTISDPDGKPLYQETLATNTNGIIHDEVTTNVTAALGSYFIQVKAGESEMAGNFEVQEYKKPEYSVQVTPDKPRVLEGESAQAIIDARYYFGEPVNGAKVKYSIYRSRYWFPLWYEPDEEGGEDAAGGDIYPDAAGEQISEAEGKLDADGKLSITVPTTVSDNKIDYRYRIEAAVTDQAGREISGTGWVIATYGTFVLDVEPDRYFYEPGKTGNFKIQARDYENKPVATAVHVEIGVWRWRDREVTEIKGSTNVSTSADGTATAELTIPAEGGTFRVSVSAPAGAGRTVEAFTYVWSSGESADAYSYGGEQTTQIVTDRKTYHPGDKAQIVVQRGVRYCQYGQDAS
jgi:uncharacterized protein YfaS (alpha-2-macroglobulin family)